MNHKTLPMKTEYALSSNETVNIIPIGDFHIGSSQFNQEFYEYMLNTIKKLKNRRIYLMGDLLENASKKVGNSAYTTTMTLDEQKEYLLDTIAPFKEDIIGYAIGNHEARLIKDYDFNNEYTLDIFTRHGKGSSGKRHLSMGKLERDTEHIVADIYLEGHNHRCMNWNKLFLDKTGLYRRYYGYTGAFLNYRGSYAESMYLNIEPPAYQTISINRNKRIKFNQHFCDLETNIKFM